MMTIYGSNGNGNSNSYGVGAGVGGGATAGGGGPARVLLLGYGWEPMQEALSAVAGGGIVLMGPEPVYDAGKDYGGAAPHILLLAPGDDIILEPGRAEPGHREPGHREPGGGRPPALRCVAGAELDAPTCMTTPMISLWRRARPRS